MSSPTLAERILAHLAATPVAPGAHDVPREVTQDGIAEALGAQVAHVSRALKRLIAQQLVTAHLAHPKGARRRSRAYTLTDEGRRAARPVAAATRPKPTAEPARRLGVPAGRAAEMARLLTLLDSAMKGSLRVALVEGPSGMGKTRLLDALATTARERGARVLEARAAPAGGAQELGALARALEPLGFHARARSRSVGTPEERALAAAVESIVVAARAQPLVVLLDDVHLAGVPPVEFLQGVLTALPEETRALVVVAFRQEEAWELPNGPLYSALFPLRALPHATHLTLAPLESPALANLLADAGGAPLEPELLARVHRESGGIPTYALAMAEALADGVQEEDFFPPAVRVLAQERFLALPPDALAVLQLAAVAGTEADYDTLARGFEGAEAQLVTALDVLLDRLLLEEVPGGADLRVRFEHPKVREAVLADISATRRRWLEGRIARAHAAPSS